MKQIVKKQVLCLLFTLLIVLFLPVWGTPQTLPVATPEERLLFEEAKRLVQDGHVLEGISSLDLFFLNHPESAFAPDALIESGKASGQLGNLKKAVESFRLFLEKFPKESRVNAVRSQLSYAYLAMGGITPAVSADQGGVEEALSVWKDIVGQESIKTPIYTRAVEIYSERDQYANALRVLLQKKGFLTNSSEIETTTSAIIAIIRNRLTEKELQTVSAESRPRFPSDEAIIQLIKLYNKKEILYLAEKESKRFLSLFPNHAYAEEATEGINNIRAKIKENEYLIGVILPLSGKLSQFGISALQGVELALKQYKIVFPSSSVGLAVKDSDEGTLEEWLKDYMPLGIVGPLLSREVNQVAPIAERGRLALITPGASSATLLSMGRAVFRNATTPASQCHAISEYAIRTLELKRFAILFSNDRSGKEWVRCLRENVNLMGGKIVLAQSYLPNETDFKDPIGPLKKAYEKTDGVGFDGIFLPGDASSVGLILPQLFFHDIKNTVLLGTMGWSDPDFLKLARKYAEGAVFVDGFFAESQDPFIQKFVSQYRKEFHEDPNLLAAQAYDAANIIITAIKEGGTSRSDIRSAISGTRDFEAVSGYISEIKDGEAIKKPFLIQVKNGKLVQVN
jgi:ABC-type branched-subunit amino acid transport system substrate-binding protein